MTGPSELGVRKVQPNGVDVENLRPPAAPVVTISRRAQMLLIGEVVRLGKVEGMVRAVQPESPGYVRIVFENYESVVTPSDARWGIVDSPFSHLRHDDIAAIFGWLFPGGPASRGLDAAGAA
jgi:hypothetical protein